MKNQKRAIHIIVGILLFITCVFILPRDVFDLSMRYVIATMVLMIYWWITRPVHLAATALLPILVNSIFVMAPMNTILDDYFSSIVVLIIGANILLASWALWKLDKRIALTSLSLIGTHVNLQIITWFVLSVILSMFLPNVVVVAALCPIAFSMMKYCSTDQVDYTKSKTLNLLLVSIVWGAGLGGFGTPLGGAMNLVAISHIEDFIGKEFLYITWTANVIVFLLLLTVAIIGYLLLIKKDIKQVVGSKEFFTTKLHDMGKMSKGEVISLVLFLLALLMAFTRPLYSKLLPNLQPQYVFLILAFVSFFIKVDNKRLMTWQVAVKNIHWSLIILFSGGLAIGKLLVESGVASALASLVSTAGISNELLLLATFIALGMFLSNTSSNTAASAILIPIVISVTIDLSLNTMAYIFVSAIACNIAYVLPTSIRAIPVDYGLDTKFMLKKGLMAIVISYILLLVSGYIFVLL